MVGQMPAISRNRLKLRDIIQGSQFESGVSQWVKKLRDLHKATPEDEFFEDLIHYLQFALTNDERSKYVNRVLEVICKFGISFLEDEEGNTGAKKGEEEEEEEEEDKECDEMPEFLIRLLHWLLDHHELEGTMARLRICLMVNRLLKLMGENAFIQEELFQKIYDNMQERLQDKVAVIRSQAVTALQRLQNPVDDSCPIIKAFVFHLSCDPSPIVRKTVIQCLAVTKLTLVHVLKRTKDIDDSVRVATYKIIASKIHVRSLTIAQREDILKRGMGDTAEAAREIIKKDLIQAWLRHSNADVLKLLYALDVSNSSEPELADSTLGAVFEDVPNTELLQQFQFLGDDNLVPSSKVTSEIAVYWRNLMKKFHDDSDDNNLERVVPELSKFCKYVRSFVMETIRDKDDEDEKVGTHVFIIKQLILMMQYFDLSDEAGRANLGNLMKDMLLSSKVCVLLVPQIIEVYQRVCSNTQTRVQDIAEIIAEIREPMKDDADDIFDKSGDEMEVDSEPRLSEEEKRKMKMKMGKMRVEMNELRNELDQFIQERDFVKAQEVKTKMDTLDSSIKEIQNEISNDNVSVPPVTSIAPSENKTSNVDNEKADGDDPVLVHKCLEMVCCLMKDIKITSLNAILKTLLDEFIVPNIKNMNFPIRQSAVRALGLCALRSAEDAKKYIVLIMRVACMDKVSVRVTAISVINDFLMAHGLGAFTEDETTRHENTEFMADIESLSITALDSTALVGCKEGNSVVAFLIKRLDDPDCDVRTKVIESLCKLQISGLIASSKLFSRLMLFWFNPLTESDGKLSHILGKFFPLYASLSRTNQDIVAEAFLPTLECLWSAPITSPLTGVNIEDVISFYVRLTKDDMLQNQSQIISDSNIHDSMANSISNMIIDDQDSGKCRFLTKSLTTLQLSASNVTQLKELKVLHSKMASLISDKICLKNLERYGLNLDTWLSKHTSTFNNHDIEVEMANITVTEEDTSVFTPSQSRMRTLLSQKETLYDSGDPEGKDDSE
uniref:NonSMC condensin I complex, subunit G [Mustela putorius furo] n=1 Tax=Lepeophtheirus salmonis TaxID=72036 RepID=A0A0K2UZM0_LEPSM